MPAKPWEAIQQQKRLLEQEELKKLMDQQWINSRFREVDVDEHGDKNFSRVRVSRKDLLGKVTQNRAAHEKAFLAAMEGWRTQAKEALHERLEVLRSDKEGFDEKGLYFDMDQPKNFLHDYDTKIRMLEMSVDDNVTLSEGDFHELVMDDWSWKNQFVGTTARYSIPRLRR